MFFDPLILSPFLAEPDSRHNLERLSAARLCQLIAPNTTAQVCYDHVPFLTAMCPIQPAYPPRGGVGTALPLYATKESSFMWVILP